MRPRLTFSSLVVLAVAVRSGTVVGQPVEQWTVSAEPVVSIGAVDGPDGQVLVNPLMATVFSDGSIAIQNSTRGTFEIRYFDGTGSHIHTASRWGEGPFEFRTAIGVHRLPGDSVLVVGRVGRVAVFGPRGERGREGRVGLRPLLPLMISYLVDGTHLALPKPQIAGPTQPGTRRSASTLLLFDIEDDGADTLGVLLGRKTHYEKMDIGLAIIPTPFSPETLVAAGRGMVWVGDSETPTIRGFRVDQRDEVAMVQSPFDARSISRSDRSRTQEAYAEHYSRSRYARSLEFPDQMPRFEQLKVDRLGNLWVQEYEPFWAEGDQHWAVFSTGGRQLADVTIPPNAIPPCARKATRSCNVLTGIFEIGSDYILVPQTDEWGVRYVRKFNIQKPSDMMSGRSER